MNAHDHIEAVQCGPNCPTRSARLSPAALIAAIAVTVLVALMVMPFSWLMHIARAVTVIGLLAMLVGFVACVTYLVIGAAVGQRSIRKF